MSNMTVYRKGFVLSLAIVLLTFGLQGVGYCQADSTADPELSVNHIYDKVIRSVVWIITNNSQGSGVLIDRDLRIVVTNHHVTKDHKAMMVCFPVRDRNGDLIEDREFYVDNLEILTRLGYASEGRIMDNDSEKDLAIVQLSGLPETAREIEYNFNYPAHFGLNRKDLVHIFGNPGDLNLWRWTLGAFQGVDQGLLRINADIYPGNSGGPVVNGHGILIGLATLSNRGTDTWAIPSSDIKDLLIGLQPRQIFSIQNNTGFTVHYQIRWKEDKEWKNTAVKQGVTMNHWYNGPAVAIPEGYPKIRFDYIANDEEFTPLTYELGTYIRILGSDPGAHIRREDARRYHFGYNSHTKKLDLYDSGTK